MFPKQNNKWYPLPPDYGDLSADGQRQARVAVCRDCSCAEAYIAGHMFFRMTYLAPLGESFYGEGNLQPPAQGHFNMLADFFNFPLCVEAYGRGYGKTTLISKELTTRETVCFPYRQVAVSMANDKLVARVAEPIMVQLEENARLNDDFAHDFGGRLVPKKGQRRIFNKHYMGLMNGSVLEMLTIGSRQRGTRTSRYILDDPEYDPTSKTQERRDDLREQLEYFIERQVLYMLRPGHMKFFWVGTMIGAWSYLYHVCFSKDPKFNAWTRRVQSGAVLDKETGEIKSSTWEARFSTSHLKFVKSVSDSAFMAEVMNCPAEETERLLKVAPVANEYKVDKLPDNIDAHNAAHLPNPDAEMTYYYFTGYNESGQRNWQIDTVNQKEHFDKMLRIVTFDYAENNTSKSDLKALSCIGIDGRNMKWVMDVWAGRMPDPQFWDFMIRWCAAWRVHIIAPESIARQRFLVDTISRRLYEGESEGLIPSDWHPQIIPVEYPQGKENINKGYRIKEAFEYQLPRGTWKFPASYKAKWPFNEMYKQLQFFTIDLSELKRDDIIDSLSMERHVKHGKGTAEPTRGVNRIENIRTMIRQGKPLIEGQEGLVGMPIGQVREDYIGLLMQRQDAQDRNELLEEINVWDQPTIIA